MTAGQEAPAAGVAGLIARLVRDVPDYPQPGILFKDITPLLADAGAFDQVVDALAAGHGPVGKVAGIEARGFILAAPVALRLQAGFVPVRKQGKLPAATLRAELRPGVRHGHAGGAPGRVQPGERVLIVDDVLATGGTARATAELVRRCGAEVAGISVLLELGFLAGRSRLEGLDVRSLLVV